MEDGRWKTEVNKTANRQQLTAKKDGRLTVKN